MSLPPRDLLAVALLALPPLFAFLPRTWLPEQLRDGKWSVFALLLGFTFIGIFVLFISVEMLQAECAEGITRACEIRAWWRGTEY